jgi:opacity protein-like surface antigen
LLTLTGRYPFGRFAPYVTGGLGFIDGGATLYKFFNEKNAVTNAVVTHEREFWTTDPVSNNHLRALGQIGAGLEFRVTCHIGLMADFTWNFVFGQDNHPDKVHVITEQGTSTVTTIDDLGILPTTVVNTVVINRANELRPGHGSDNQDFGMARFGVTFSY